MTLSRRDRAAMTLALECLRWWPLTERACRYAVPSAVEALRKGEDVSSWIDCALMDTEDLGVPARLLRARLALALRVLLRADAGDFGPRERWLQCQRCWRIEYDLDSEAARQGVCVPYPRGDFDCPGDSHAPAFLLPMQWPLPPYRRVRPLWESAPAHEVSR